LSLSQTRSEFFFEEKKFGIIFLIVIILIASFFLINNMEIPGPFVDDSRVIQASQLFIDNYEFPNGFKIFGKVFPLGNFYNGVPQLYIIDAPLVYLLGPTLITIRVVGIILFVLTTIFTYFFAKELFNQKIALVSASFFALAPITLLIINYPSYGSSITSLFLVVSFYFLIKWKNTKKTLYMVGAFIIFGLGFDVKINFIWPILALIFAFIIFRPQIDLTLKKLAIIIISAITGAILFVIRWVANFDKYVFEVSYFGANPRESISNTEIIPNLVSRFEQVFNLVEGKWVSIAFGGNYSNESFAFFFFLSIAGILLMGIKNRDQYFRRSVFLVFIFLVILALSIFTFTSRTVSSLFFLMPLIAIIMATFVVNITEKISNLKSGKIISPVIFFGILAFLLIGNIIVINDYKVQAEKTGGTEDWSVHFLEAGRFLLEQNYSKVTTLDTMLIASIFVSTEGKVDINEISLPLKDEYFINVFKSKFIEALQDPEMVYLKYNDDYVLDRRRNMDLVNQVLDSENKKFIIIKTFMDWRGNNHTSIYKAVDIDR